MFCEYIFKYFWEESSSSYFIEVHFDQFRGIKKTIDDTWLISITWYNIKDTSENYLEYHPSSEKMYQVCNYFAANRNLHFNCFCLWDSVTWSPNPVWLNWSLCMLCARIKPSRGSIVLFGNAWMTFIIYLCLASMINGYKFNCGGTAFKFTWFSFQQTNIT